MSELVWSKHPVIKVPTKEQVMAMGLKGVEEFYVLREDAIRKERLDPLRYGYEPTWWKTVDEWMVKKRLANPSGVLEELDLGGNRASKSERAAKRRMERMVNEPGRRVWCCQGSQTISQQTQQPLMWKYLPVEWRPTATGKLRKGVSTKIVYSQAGGFTEDTFVLPNGSQCWFKFYTQDVKTLEGPELDEVWCDELVTPDWMEALRYRLVTRNGTLHVTFTPVEGYSATVKTCLGGAKTLLDAEADPDLLPVRNAVGEVIGGERVPRVQQATNPMMQIFYFHTADNPFNDYESMKATLASKSRETILMRAYGVPTKAISGRFPKFKQGVHTIPANRIPVTGTRYLIIDPCGGRNWFMTWVLVDSIGRKFIYREWPCEHLYIDGVGHPGAWAEPDGKKADGRRGPAQVGFGFGMKRYKEEVERLERLNALLEKPVGAEWKAEHVLERYMDSRYGNAATVGKEESTTLIEEMEELGMSFLPTPGDDIDEGVDLINTLLDYDVEMPVDALNQPKLYVNELCTNTIYGLQEWTGKDGRHGACKDPVDNVRYAALLNLEDVSGLPMLIRGRGVY